MAREYTENYKTKNLSVEITYENSSEYVLPIRKELKGHLADCGPSD